MNAGQFDRTAARFAEMRLSRRTALAGGGAGIVAVTSAATSIGSVHAQDATPVPEGTLDTVHPDSMPEPPDFLFVQSFVSGSLVPVSGQDGAYTLTLDGANPQTIFFSDRPERVFGMAPMGAFLDGLGFTPENPPNAALVATTDDGAEDVLIIELLDPVWDETAGTLTYSV